MACEYCEGTGYYGDNGPGITGNTEWHPCDQCDADPAKCECFFWARESWTTEELNDPPRHHPRCNKAPASNVEPDKVNES